MRICSFLWVYYGYPTSTYEGVNVECMRNRCGDLLAQHDERSDIHIDSVAGVPDSGMAALFHADQPETAQHDRKDEIDSGTGAH